MWAVALSILSEAEVQERARREAAAARRSSALPPLRDPKSPAANPMSVSPQAPQPQRGTTYAPPPQSPKPSPPPPVIRPPAPAPRRTPAVQPNIAVPGPPQQNVSPSLASQQTPWRGLTLRGCLMSVVLLIIPVAAAVFAVLAVITILQEEQARPSSNDPRIR